MKGRGKSIRTGDYHSSRRDESEVPMVDLHGLRYHIGERRLETFLNDQIAKRAPSVRVNHGHGGGDMRRITYEWIERHQHIIANHYPMHNDGWVHINFKRR